MRPAVRLLALGLAACSRGDEERAAGPPPPVPVTVAVAAEKAVPIQLHAIGNVVPSNTVTVRARVAGALARVHFTEGQDVREGQLLFTLDRAPLEAELRQAEGTLDAITSSAARLICSSVRSRSDPHPRQLLIDAILRLILD